MQGHLHGGLLKSGANSRRFRSKMVENTGFVNGLWSRHPHISHMASASYDYHWNYIEINLAQPFLPMLFAVKNLDPHPVELKTSYGCVALAALEWSQPENWAGVKLEFFDNLFLPPYMSPSRQLSAQR